MKDILVDIAERREHLKNLNNIACQAWALERRVGVRKLLQEITKFAAEERDFLSEAVEEIKQLRKQITERNI